MSTFGNGFRASGNGFVMQGSAPDNAVFVMLEVASRLASNGVIFEEHPNGVTLDAIKDAHSNGTTSPILVSRPEARALAMIGAQILAAAQNTLSRDEAAAVDHVIHTVG